MDSPEIRISRGRDSLTDLNRNGVNASELEHRRCQAQDASIAASDWTRVAHDIRDHRRQVF